MNNDEKKNKRIITAAKISVCVYSQIKSRNRLMNRLAILRLL